MQRLALPKMVVAASGAMGFDGKGWNIAQRFLFAKRLTSTTKTVTLEPRPFRPLTTAYRPFFWRRSSVNAMALGNIGLERFLEEILPNLEQPSIISVHASDPHDMYQIVTLLQPALISSQMAIAVEVNLSCPNVQAVENSAGILEAASSLRKPVLAKIGYQQYYRDLAIWAAEQQLISGISAINTIPWADIFGEKVSPLQRTCQASGGVAGALIKSAGIATVTELRRRLDSLGLCDFPIVGGGGILCPKDAADYRGAGASHISLGTALTWPWLWPWALATIKAAK